MHRKTTKIAEVFFVIVLISLFTPTRAQDIPHILDMRDRSAVVDRLLQDKFENVLPELMERAGIDMWVVISREYNEDPVIRTMLPSTWLSARRRTILVMFRDGEKVERLAVARYAVADLFEKSWDKEKEPDQWKRLVEIIEDRNPKKIGLNFSKDFGLADGMASTDLRTFMDKLPGKYQKRVVSAENLAISWLETRTKQEMLLYPQICRIAHQIIAEGFSEKVIQPGITSTDDLVWWYRERIRDLKLIAWFNPSVNIQRNDNEDFDHVNTFSNVKPDNIIMPGDLLHVDFGITYLRLNTDTQQHAYVLKKGEYDAPDYLKKALAKGNRLQDIFTNEFSEGRTGNEVLLSALEKAKKEGLKPHIYTHPIGYHGHGAGPTIGLWDQQGGVPGKGDYPLYLNTAYSIELNTAVYLQEWQKEIRIMLEEEAFFDETGVWYIDGRQEEFHLIPRPSNINK
jgi:hypothetical protein